MNDAVLAPPRVFLEEKRNERVVVPFPRGFQRSRVASGSRDVEKSLAFFARVAHRSRNVTNRKKWHAFPFLSRVNIQSRFASIPFLFWMEKQFAR